MYVLYTQSYTDIHCSMSKLYSLSIQLEREHYFSQLVAQPQPCIHTAALHCDGQSAVLHNEEKREVFHLFDINIQGVPYLTYTVPYRR